MAACCLGATGWTPPAEFTYDPTTGLVLTAKDPSGVVTTTTYSHAVNVASVSTPLNGSTTRVVTYQHANAAHPGDVTKVIDPRNKQWVYGYDSYGDVASVTDPAGNQSTTSYDLIGRPVTGVAPKGVAGTPSDYRSTVAYDLNGRAGAVFGPTGAGLVDSFGRPPSVTGLGSTDTGQAWTAATGVWGIAGGAYPVSGSNPLALVTAGALGSLSFTMPVAQAGMGVVFRASDSGHYWKLTANPSTNNWTLAKVGGTAVTPVTTAAGTCCDRNKQVTVFFNGSGMFVVVDGQAIALATDTEYTANTKIGVIAPATGTGRIGSFAFNTTGTAGFTSYDANGNPVVSIDGQMHVTKTAWDLNGQPTLETRGDGTTITDTFDANGRLTGYTAKDPTNNPAVTTYGYDAQNRLTAEDPAGPVGATVYSYAYSPTGAPGGETATMTQPGGGTTTATLDAAGRLASIDYSDTTPDVTYGYDPDGRTTTMARTGASPSSWTYDQLGRMTSSTRATRSVSYGYDLAGNNTSITYPGSHTVTRHYDDASRLDAVTDWNNATTAFGYDANSNLTTTTFPNGVTTTRTYDRENRPTNIEVKNTSTTLAAWAQTYDNNNFVTNITATGLGSNQTYSYNTLNQLSSNNSNPFTYDPADNLTTLAPTTRQKFNESNQICWQTSAWTPTADYNNNCPSPAGWSTTYTFDARGNRTITAFPFATNKTHTYDLANRLTSYSDGTNTANYTYDADGLRLAKTVNTTDTLYTWQDNTNLPQLLVDGTDNYLYGPLGEPIARIPSTGTTTYIHQDHLGSTRLLTNNTGTTTGTYTYNPYGTTQTHTGASVSLQYAGQYTDTETGYQYLRARYYDPGNGQFITRDPIEGLTREPHAYAGGDPANGIDPSGMSTCGEATSILEAAGSLVDCISKLSPADVAAAARKAAIGLVVEVAERSETAALLRRLSASSGLSVGRCGSASELASIELAIALCMVATPDGGFAVTTSVSVGMGILMGADLTGSLFLSNARCLEDLRGTFGYANLTGGELLVGSAILGWSTSSSGSRIWSLTVGAGIGAEAPLPVSGTGGVGFTGVHEGF